MQSVNNAKPWFKELWFWLLISPMLTLLVSVPIMLTTAFKGADDRVLDNYYKEGRMINHRFEEQKLAALLNLQGAISVNPSTQELSVLFKTPMNAPTITLEFSHPAAKERDFIVELSLTSPEHYWGMLPKVSGRWYVLLTGKHQDRLWRIPAEITIEAEGRTEQSFIAEL